MIGPPPGCGVFCRSWPLWNPASVEGAFGSAKPELVTHLGLNVSLVNLKMAPVPSGSSQVHDF